MGKKLGLDKAYNALKTVTGSYPITGGTPKSTFMKRGLNLTTSVNKGSKLLNVGKKVFSKTPVGKAVNLAINVGSGIGIGYSYAKNKFNKKKADFQKGDYSDIKTDKKMGGGMMQGYGAARTSGMGLEDQSLMPGQMVRASKGTMLSAKQKKIARMAPPPDKITGADFKAMKAKNGKMIGTTNTLKGKNAFLHAAKYGKMMKK